MSSRLPILGFTFLLIKIITQKQLVKLVGGIWFCFSACKNYNLKAAATSVSG